MTQVEMVLRVLTAFGLTFSLGFEREIRGSAAGDRTFSLIGVGAAVIGVLSANGAPTILSGAVTGVGFIGAGLLFRQSDQNIATVHGVTTAAAILASAAIGAVSGAGYYLLATVSTALVILSLEFRYIPGVRLLDARRWSHHFKDDTDPHHGAPPTGFTIASPAEAHAIATHQPDAEAINGHQLDEAAPRHTISGSHAFPNARIAAEAELAGVLRAQPGLAGAPVSPITVAQMAAQQSAITADADEAAELGSAASRK